MCKTKLHKKQKHGKNHGKTNVKKETVQQLSENMPPKHYTPTPHQNEATQQKIKKKPTKNKTERKHNQKSSEADNEDKYQQKRFTREPRLQNPQIRAEAPSKSRLKKHLKRK
jgi:hypothetical protein